MGVYVGGTIDNNKLHDYEEGDWTPDVLNRTSASVSVRAGKYIKVGRVVHLICHFDSGNTTVTSSSSTFSVSGMPFAARGGSAYASTASVHFNNGYSTAGNKGELHGLVPPNQTHINIYYSDSSTMVHLPVSQFGTGNFLFTCTYITSA
tara:strand:- start:36 stop:482 length:447 start_codon:yes stop_codon:yes gene_type:complete